jgi:hypothetical protein
VSWRAGTQSVGDDVPEWNFPFFIKTLPLSITAFLTRLLMSTFRVLMSGSSTVLNLVHHSITFHRFISARSRLNCSRVLFTSANLCKSVRIKDEG